MSVETKSLSKSFGDVIAVDDVSISFMGKKISTILGPSGCGKTTTLRCIAGLEKPDAGDIWIQEKLVSSKDRQIFVPPEKREIGMVFQSYAIWPHMKIVDNVAYPLKIRKMSKQDIDEKVNRALGLVGLLELKDRYATQLSGGQQQRVALARALSYGTKVLLLDEPLSNLDAKLREQMRFEIRELQRKLGITVVYVTHDQAEAMAISDEIIVMNKGKKEQVGSAYEIYRKPSSPFVAEFIGLTNFLPGIIREKLETGFCYQVEIHKANTSINIPIREGMPDLKAGRNVLVSIRPENIGIKPHSISDAICMKGRVAKATFLGNVMDYRINVGELEIRVQSNPCEILKEGNVVYLTVDPEDCAII